MGLLVGEFALNVDAKHRLAIPAALRERVVTETDGDEFYLILGPDGHLWLYPNLAYERLQARMVRGALPDRQSGKLSLLYAMARVVKPDKQGRVVLPETSMKRARLSENDAVTLVGSYDHIEIWPTATWERHVEESLPTYGEMVYEEAERCKRESTMLSDPPAR